VLKCSTLLIGLPALLHLLLGLSQARYGGWLAVGGTLAVGIGLSVVYHRRPTGRALGDGIMADDPAWAKA